MTQTPVWRWLAAGLAGTVAGSAMTAVAAADDPKVALPTVKACANKSTGQLRLATPACKASERRVSWAVRGPRGATGLAGPAGAAGPEGPAGPAGPPGALTTTPISATYLATRTSAYVVDVGGLTINLECGTSRIGSTNVDVYVQGADEVHGTAVKTRYNGGSLVDTVTEVIDASGTAAAPGSVSAGGGATHATMLVDWVVRDGGVVQDLSLYATRDTRQGRPVCEFIGSLTELGPATVVPS